MLSASSEQINGESSEPVRAFVPLAGHRRETRAGMLFGDLEERGDALVAGAHFGRVRAMHDFVGGRVKRATPGQPVEMLGFDGVPQAGELVRVVENERRARQLAGERANRLKTEALARRSGRKVSLEDVFKLAQEGAVKELGLVVKADVAGSLEAIEDEIAKLPQQEVAVNIIHRGVGGINESDVMLAAASNAVILAFNVRPVGDARAVAEHEGVEIRSYSVIYRAIDELRLAMQGEMRSFPHNLDQRYLVLLGWGFMVPIVWGFSARWLSA